MVESGQRSLVAVGKKGKRKREEVALVAITSMMVGELVVI